MEPFSSSVLKDLTWVFATTTKICTRGGSSRPHGLTFNATSTPSYLFVRHTETMLHKQPSISYVLQLLPFSGLIASAGELLHTP